MASNSSSSGSKKRKKIPKARLVDCGFAKVLPRPAFCFIRVVDVHLC